MANDHAARREHFRSYLLACVQDSVLSFADFADVTTLTAKLGRTLAEDSRAVLSDLGRTGAAGAVSMIGAKLMEFAQKIGGGR